MYGRDTGGKGKAFAYFHDTAFCHSKPLNNVSGLYLSLKEKSIKLQGEGGCEGAFMKYVSYVMFIQADGGFYHNNRFLKNQALFVALLLFAYMHHLL